MGTECGRSIPDELMQRALRFGAGSTREGILAVYNHPSFSGSAERILQWDPSQGRAFLQRQVEEQERIDDKIREDTGRHSGDFHGAFEIYLGMLNQTASE